jgi:hypothetical protein
MATSTIEKRLAELLAARAKEHEERAKERKRIGRPRFQRRHLKWQEEQPPFWKIVRGEKWRRPTPAYLLRRHPYDVLTCPPKPIKFGWES